MQTNYDVVSTITGKTCISQFIFDLNHLKKMAEYRIKDFEDLISKYNSVKQSVIYSLDNTNSIVSAECPNKKISNDLFGYVAQLRATSESDLFRSEIYTITESLNKAKTMREGIRKVVDSIPEQEVSQLQLSGDTVEKINKAKNYFNNTCKAELEVLRSNCPWA
jgi:hypothetical protein